MLTTERSAAGRHFASRFRLGPKERLHCNSSVPLLPSQFGRVTARELAPRDLIFTKDDHETSYSEENNSVQVHDKHSDGDVSLRTPRHSSEYWKMEDVTDSMTRPSVSTAEESANTSLTTIDEPIENCPSLQSGSRDKLVKDGRPVAQWKVVGHSQWRRRSRLEAAKVCAQQTAVVIDFPRIHGIEAQEDLSCGADHSSRCGDSICGTP